MPDELSLFDASGDLSLVEVDVAIRRLLGGESGADVESETLEVKGDPVTVTPPPVAGSGGPSLETQRDRVSAYACACLANHEGGFLLLGIRDDAVGSDAISGTDVDCEALRMRIRQLTDPPLTVTVKAITINDVRVVVACVPRNASIEPHAVSMSNSGEARRPRRIHTTCQDMKSVREMISWANGRDNHDWSAVSTSLDLGGIRSEAMAVVRGYLKESGEQGRSALADFDDATILSRLGLVSGGHLNRAGMLLLTPIAGPTISYTLRNSSGDRASLRVAGDGSRALIEDLKRIEDSIDSNNPVHSIRVNESLARGESRSIPMDAIREAVINAVMHRDWSIHEPITIDHQPDQMVVFSPGGLVSGLTADALISAPSRTRNRVLGDALRGIRLAEREGMGIDKMFVALISTGHGPPEVVERDGGVRVTMVGGAPVLEVIRAYGLMSSALASSPRTAVALHLLRSQTSITIEDLDTFVHEGSAAVRSFLDGACAEQVLRRTANPRPGGTLAWRLSDQVRAILGPILPYYARPIEESVQLVADLAAQQATVRNQDVQDLLGVAQIRASQILQRAVTEGRIKLAPGSKPRGRSTRYVAC